MKIKYLGPMNRVIVAPYGDHFKDQVKDYPKEFGEELLATSLKQQFEVVGKSAEEPDEDSLELKTVAELTAMLKEKGIEVPPKARKAELIALLEQGA